MICPLCATRLGIDVEECGCGAPLKEYAVAAYLPHWLFNDALTKLRRGQWSQAATSFAQAALFLPSDQEVFRGWAFALKQAGCLEDALDKITHAQDLGDSPDIQEEVDEILALLTPPPIPEPHALEGYTTVARPTHCASRPVGHHSSFRRMTRHLL